MPQYIIPKGDTFTTQLTITDVNGTAVDLTGGTVEFFITDRTGALLHTETVTSHTTPASGITTVTITAANTATFAMGCYEYEVVTTMSDSTVWTSLDGFVEVRV